MGSDSRSPHGPVETAENASLKSWVDVARVASMQLTCTGDGQKKPLAAASRVLAPGVRTSPNASPAGHKLKHNTTTSFKWLCIRARARLLRVCVWGKQEKVGCVWPLPGFGGGVGGEFLTPGGYCMREYTQHTQPPPTFQFF